MRVLGAIPLVLGLVSGVPSVVRGETAIVDRNVNLRGDASTAHPPLSLLTKGTRLELLDKAEQAGFLHVRTAEGKEGWVFALNVRVEGTRLGAPSRTTQLPFSRRLAVARSRSASGPCAETLEGCSPDGCEVPGSAHALLNQGKRHIPPSGVTVSLSVEQLALLQQAADDLGIRQGWNSHLTQKDRDKLKKLDLGGGVRVGEGDLVEVTGFISAEHDIKASSAESVNCRLVGEPNNDIHLPIVADPQDSEYHAFVVEPIPQGTQGGNAPNRGRVERGWLSAASGRRAAIAHSRTALLRQRAPRSGRPGGGDR